MGNMQITTDVAIFGGGIAGLWLLHKLKSKGYSVILLESDTLGGGQTIRSQGIIHGGMKYALQGVLTAEAEIMADLPTRWRACLENEGEINLSAVPILSSSHYLWSPSRIAAKLGGFLAGATLNSKVQSLAKSDYPTVFQHPKFKGNIYALDEMVLDVPALIKVLAKEHMECIYKIDTVSVDDIQLNEQGIAGIHLHQEGKDVFLQAQHIVFAAGSGNQVAIEKIQQPAIAMQKRPLHMVMVKLPKDYPVYAHCLGLGARPRLTITTHYLNDGQAVWYLGGALAEEGVSRDQVAQVETAKKELSALFPWVDFSHAEFASFYIDRAEPLQKNGLKPETAVTKQFHNLTIAWPTKLALAPALADEIAKQLSIQPTFANLQALNEWKKPDLALPAWELAFCKKDI